MNELDRTLTGLSFGLYIAIFAAGCKGGCQRTGADDPPDAASSPSSSATPDAAPDAASAGLLADGGLPPAIPNASEALNRVRPFLRRCFAEQVKRAPTRTVTVTFEIAIDGGGKLVAATPTSHDGLDLAGLTCMTEKVREAVFEPPLDRMPATVIAPFTFHAVGAVTTIPDASAPRP